MFNLSQLSHKTPSTPPLTLDKHTKRSDEKEKNTSSFRIDDILIRRETNINIESNYSNPTLPHSHPEADILSRAQGLIHVSPNNPQSHTNSPLFAQLSSMYNYFSPMAPNKGLTQPQLSPEIISFLYGKSFDNLTTRLKQTCAPKRTQRFKFGFSIFEYLGSEFGFGYFSNLLQISIKII
jgi:hypothetical protein